MGCVTVSQKNQEEEKPNDETQEHSINNRSKNPFDRDRLQLIHNDGSDNMINIINDETETKNSNNPFNAITSDMEETAPLELKKTSTYDLL